MNDKAFVAMSGGVDSAVSALLMLEAGYDCEGVTIRTFSSSAVEEDIEMARAICTKLGIPHRVIDLRAEFKEHVTDRFISTYECGRTPNPCLYCNRHIKFGAMVDVLLREYPHAFIATGHYAGINHDYGVNIVKAADPDKDQSYMLFDVRPEVLPHVVFPLGGYTKDTVRKIASNNGFVNAGRHDSQDICFVPDGDHVGYIERQTGKEYPHGSFIFRDGKVLGEHKGIVAYTIGQRKGLGISYTEPIYVCRKNAEDNTVMLGLNEDLFSSECETVGANLFDRGRALLSGGDEVLVTAKTRYSHREEKCRVRIVDGRIVCRFEKPVRAVTPGQGLAIYDGEILLGGGEIS